jgi:hypothetical protein
MHATRIPQLCKLPCCSCPSPSTPPPTPSNACTAVCLERFAALAHPATKLRPVWDASKSGISRQPAAIGGTEKPVLAVCIIAARHATIVGLNRCLARGCVRERRVGYVWMHKCA